MRININVLLRKRPKKGIKRPHMDVLDIFLLGNK